MFSLPNPAGSQENLYWALNAPRWPDERINSTAMIGSIVEKSGILVIYWIITLKKEEKKVTGFFGLAQPHRILVNCLWGVDRS